MNDYPFHIDGPFVEIPQTQSMIQLPISEITKPPVPANMTNVQRGGVTQTRGAPNVVQLRDRATMNQYAPATSATTEIGQSMMVTGPTTE